MKPVEESAVTAMDGSEKELFQYLPYIFQDLWEIGADPDAIIKLIDKYFTRFTNLKVLDLGCGKGAVSVNIAKTLGCYCFGIDAIQEFIEFARQKSIEYKVEQRCSFETGDIREKVKELKGYDIIILGAIGPVFGDYYSTLTTLSGCLNKNGMFLIDDGYIDNDSNYTHPIIQKQNSIIQQINAAGMKLIENDIIKPEEIKYSDDFIFNYVKMRCLELVEKFPEKRKLFLNYIRKQQEENIVLENKIVCTTMVIRT